MERTAPGATCGTGMVAVVRGLNDAALAVTLLDSGKQYTLLPNNMLQAQPGSLGTSNIGIPKRSAATSIYNDRLNISGLNRNTSVQATDGRYASVYQTAHCHMKPTSPPTELTEFPPQRSSICRGHDNFVVGGTGSGDTNFVPIRSNGVYRGAGLVWPDRGSVCSPRPSREPDAFAKSLRRYPCYSPERSTEIVERLINYTRNNSGKVSSRVSPTRRQDYSPYADHVYRYSRSPQRTHDPAKSKSPQRTYEPDVKIRTRVNEESPSRKSLKKFEENDFRSQFSRNLDSKFTREAIRQMRASLLKAEEYTNDRDRTYNTASEQTASDQSVPTLVDTNIQASAEMTCKVASTSPKCGSFTRNVAIPGSPSSADPQHPSEGGVSSKPTRYSHHENKFTPDQTNPLPNQTNIPPLDYKKSIHTTLSSIELSKTGINVPETCKKSKSEINFSKEDGHELLEWLKIVFEENPEAKGLYDEVLRKYKCRLNARISKEGDVPKNKLEIEDCPKALSPSKDRTVNDSSKGKFKSRYTTVFRAEVNSFKTSEDFITIVRSWLNDMPMRTHDYLGRPVDKEQIIVSFVGWLKEASDASGFNWTKLRSDIVEILNEIPIEIQGHDNKISYLDRKADALVEKLQRDCCKIKTKLNVNNANLNINDTKMKPFYKEIKNFVRIEMMSCIKKFHLESNVQLLKDIEEDLVDILLNSIEALRSDENDLVTGVIATLLQDSAALFEHQAIYIASLIIDHLKLKLNDIEHIAPYVRTSGTRTLMNFSYDQDHALESTDFSIGELSEEDFDANLDVYVQLLAQQIDEWLVNIPIAVQGTHDKNFKQVVIHDLAVDIVDRHKYLELNPTIRFSEKEELEYLKFQIFKWINKLIDEDSIDTIEYAPQLMERIRSVPVPTLSSLNSIDEIKTDDDQATLTAKNYNKINANEGEDNQPISQARIICPCGESVERGKNEKPASSEESTIRLNAKMSVTDYHKNPADRSCNARSRNISVMPIYFPGKAVDTQCSSSRFGNATQQRTERLQDVLDKTQMSILPSVSSGGTMTEIPQVVPTSNKYTTPIVCTPLNNITENTTIPIQTLAPFEKLNNPSFPFVMNRRTMSAGLPKIILAGGRLGSSAGFSIPTLNNTLDSNSLPPRYGDGIKEISQVNESTNKISEINDMRIPSPPAFTEVSTLGPSSLRQNIIFDEPAYNVTGRNQMSDISRPEMSSSIPQTTSFTYSMPEIRQQPIYGQSGYDILQRSGVVLRQEYTKQERNGQPLLRPTENVIHRTISSAYMVQQMNQAPMSGSWYPGQSSEESRSQPSQAANSLNSSNMPQDTGAKIKQTSPPAISYPAFQQLSDQYDSFVQDWVQAIPISAASQEEKEYAEKVRMHLYNGIWKAVTKLKSQPHLMFNRFHYEDALDDEIENLFTLVPQSQDFLNKKHLLKINLIEKTSQLNEMIKVAYAPDVFKQELVEKMGIYVPRFTTEDGDVNRVKLYEDLQKLYLAEEFILYTRYKEEDPVRAHAYKDKLLKRIQEFVDELKCNHNAELKDIDRDIYMNDMWNALQQVPLPSDTTVREAADEALLGLEIEQWYNNVPVVHNNDLTEQLKRRKLRDLLAKRLHEIEKSIVTTDNTTEGAIRNEISLFLKKVPLERDESLNINNMVDNLVSRVMNREKERNEETRKRKVLFHNTIDYQEFTEQLPISSSVLEIPGSKLTPPGFVSYSQSFRPPVTEPSGAVNFGVMQKVDVQIRPCSDIGTQTETEPLRYVQKERPPYGNQLAIEGKPYENYPSTFLQSLPPSTPIQYPQQSIEQSSQQPFQGGTAGQDLQQSVVPSPQKPFQGNMPGQDPQQFVLQSPQQTPQGGMPEQSPQVQSPQQTFQGSMPGPGLKQFVAQSPQQQFQEGMPVQGPRQPIVQPSQQPFQDGISGPDPRQFVVQPQQQPFQSGTAGQDAQQSVVPSPQKPFQGNMPGQDPQQSVLKSPQQMSQSGMPGQDTRQSVVQSPHQILQGSMPGPGPRQSVGQPPKQPFQSGWAGQDPQPLIIPSPQQTFQGSMPEPGPKQFVAQSPQQPFQDNMPGQGLRQSVVQPPQQPFQGGMPGPGPKQFVAPSPQQPFQDSMPGQGPRQSVVQPPQQPFQGGMSGPGPRQFVAQSPQQPFQDSMPGQGPRQSVVQPPQQPFQGGMPGPGPKQFVAQSPQQPFQDSMPGQGPRQSVVQPPQQPFQDGMPGYSPRQFIVQSPQQPFQNGTLGQGPRKSILQPPQQTFQGSMPGQGPRQSIVQSPQQPFQNSIPGQGLRQSSPQMSQNSQYSPQSGRFPQNSTVQDPGSYGPFSYGRPTGGTWQQSDDSSMPHYTLPDITPPQAKILGQIGDQSYGQPRQSLGQGSRISPGQTPSNANQYVQRPSQAAGAYPRQSLGGPQLQNSMAQPMNRQSLARHAGEIIPRQSLGRNLVDPTGQTTARSMLPVQSTQSPAGWNQPIQKLPEDVRRQGGNVPRQSMARPGEIITGQYFPRQEAQTQSPAQYIPKQNFAGVAGPRHPTMTDTAIDARPKQDQGQNPMYVTGPEGQRVAVGGFATQTNLGQVNAKIPGSGQPGQSATIATGQSPDNLLQGGNIQTLRVPCKDVSFQTLAEYQGCYCPPNIIKIPCETFAKPCFPRPTKQCIDSQTFCPDNIELQNLKRGPNQYYICRDDEGMQQADGSFRQPVGYSTPQQGATSSPRICRRPLQAPRPEGGAARSESGFTDDESDLTSRSQRKKCRCIGRMKKCKKRREICYANVGMTYGQYSPVRYYYPFVKTAANVLSAAHQESNGRPLFAGQEDIIFNYTTNKIPVKYKYVQTTHSLIDLITLKKKSHSKICRSKSYDELSISHGKAKIQDKHRDTVRVKKSWNEKLQKLAEKLKKPGGEEKLRARIKKCLETVPSHFPECDELGKKVREELPDNIIKKLKTITLKTERKQSLFKDNQGLDKDIINTFKSIVKDWLEKLPIKKKDFLDREIKKEDIYNAIVNRLLPFISHRPSCKNDFRNMLKSYLMEIVDEIPIEFDSFDKKECTNRITDDLVYRLLVHISDKGHKNREIQNNWSKSTLKFTTKRAYKSCYNCYYCSIKKFQKAFNVVKDFVSEEMIRLLSDKDIGISLKNMMYIEKKLATFLIDTIESIKNDKEKENIEELFQEAFNLNEIQARDLATTIVRDFRDVFYKKDNKIRKKNTKPKRSPLGNSYSETYIVFHNAAKTMKKSKTYAEYFEKKEICANSRLYSRQVEKQVHKWLASLNLKIPVKHSQVFRKIAVCDLAGDIVDRKRYLELNSTVELTPGDELQNLQFQIYKWLEKLLGDEILQAINRAPDLMKRIQAINVPKLTRSGLKKKEVQHSPRSLSEVPTNGGRQPQTQSDKPNVDQLYETIFGPKAEENFKKLLVRDLAVNISRDFKDKRIHEDIIDKSVDLWTQEVLKQRQCNIIENSKKRGKSVSSKPFKPGNNELNLGASASKRNFKHPSKTLEEISIENSVEKRTSNKMTSVVDSYDFYFKEIVKQIEEWLINLHIKEVNQNSYINVAIRDLAADIVDRCKYLEMNPTHSGTDKDELENLKYQIFKWINSLIGLENLQTIEKAELLMNRIRAVSTPVTLDIRSDWNIQTCAKGDEKHHGRINDSMISLMQSSHDIIDNESIQQYPSQTVYCPILESAGVRNHEFLSQPTKEHATARNVRDTFIISDGENARHCRESQSITIAEDSVEHNAATLMHLAPRTQDHIQMQSSIGKINENMQTSPTESFNDEGTHSFPSSFRRLQISSSIQTNLAENSAKYSACLVDLPDIKIEGRHKLLKEKIGPMLRHEVATIPQNLAEVYQMPYFEPTSGTEEKGQSKGDMDEHRKQKFQRYINMKYDLESTQLPKDMTVNETYQYFDRIFRGRIEELPIEAVTMEEKRLAELSRSSVYKNIWKIFFKLKSSPSVEDDYVLFEAMFETHIDLILDYLPQTPDCLRVRQEWKRSILFDFITMLRYIHNVTETPNFRKLLVEKMNKGLVQTPLPKYSDQEQCKYAANVANAFILYKNYKNNDTEKANFYRQHLMNRLEELTYYIKNTYDLEFRFVDRDKLREKAFKILLNVPLPKDETLKDEADEILIDEELQDWYNELPVIPITDVKDDMWRNRMREMLAKKINAYEKELNLNDPLVERELKDEISRFLEDDAKLQPYEKININFMVEDLVVRLKSLRLKRDTAGHKTYEQEMPDNSTYKHNCKVRSVFATQIAGSSNQREDQRITQGEKSCNGIIQEKPTYFKYNQASRNDSVERNDDSAERSDTGCFNPTETPVLTEGNKIFSNKLEQSILLKTVKKWTSNVEEGSESKPTPPDSKERRFNLKEGRDIRSNLAECNELRSSLEEQNQIWSCLAERNNKSLKMATANVRRSCLADGNDSRRLERNALGPMAFETKPVFDINGTSQISGHHYIPQGPNNGQEYTSTGLRYSYLASLPTLHDLGANSQTYVQEGTGSSQELTQSNVRNNISQGANMIPPKKDYGINPGFLYRAQTLMSGPREPSGFFRPSASVHFGQTDEFSDDDYDEETVCTCIRCLNSLRLRGYAIKVPSSNLK